MCSDHNHSVIAGIVMIAAGLQGHLVGVGSFSSDIISWVYRGGLVIGGLALAYPETLSNVVGLVVLFVVVIVRRLTLRSY